MVTARLQGYNTPPSKPQTSCWSRQDHLTLWTNPVPVRNIRVKKAGFVNITLNVSSLQREVRGYGQKDTNRSKNGAVC